MKKTIKLLCTWAASLLLAGCSSEADMEKLMDWQSNPDAVHFTASVNNATTRTNPAATDDAQTKFNENDQVTVSNNGNQADYAYKEKSWVPAIADKYLLWDRSNLTFNCWYPSGGNNTATVGYLTPNQSSTDLMAKSDYMNATTVLQTANDPLNFSLERKTARIILKISGFTEQFESTPTIKKVCIVSNASTAADETKNIEITPLTNGGGGKGTTYTALVAPGKVVAKLYFSDNTSSEEPVTMTTNVTAAGNSYIYNLIVGKKKIEVTGITAGTWGQGTEIVDNLTSIPYVTFTADAIQELMIAQVENIRNLQYSVNFGEWKDAKSDDGFPWSVLFGGKKGCLRLRCKRNFQGTAYGDDNYAQISFSKSSVKVACTGDIRTLLDYDNYEAVKTSGAQFCSLFEGCKQLTSAPDLPATELYDYCYNSMFKGCESLEKAPALPATTLKQSCYNEMFQGCISLKEAPVLRAMDMAPSAYRSMFYGCTSLVTAPALPATTTAKYCYQNMFMGCASLKNVPVELPAIKMNVSCYTNMFNGCTSLENAPKLQATTLADNCYSSMFGGCTNLKTAPDLPAEKLYASCYYHMFAGCSKLEIAPKLSAKSLDMQCCSYMFYKCTSLKKAPDLPATNLALNCYEYMFWGCTSLTTAPKLPADDLYNSCYYGMFKECTSLTTAPDLPATTLADYCYKEMFNGCKNLKSVKMLAPSHNKMSDYFTDWLTDAGTSTTTGRTLIVKDQTAYDALKTNNLLPADYWQAGKCTVKAANGSVIK